MVDSKFDANIWADIIYRAYPLHKDRGHAIPAIKKALKSIDRQELFAAVGRFAASVKGKDPKFIPYCATWMNGERWLDEQDKPSEECLPAIKNYDGTICPICGMVEYWPTDRTRTTYRCRRCGHSGVSPWQ